jgi:2-methylcitrate dehydratase PrpD
LGGNNIDAADIVSVTVAMASQAAEIVDARNMSSISVQDMVSLGMVRGRLTYEDAHDEAGLRSPEVQAMKAKVTVIRDPQLAALGSHNRASWVEIQTKDGTHRSAVHLPPGHWDAGGMPWADAEVKFRALVAPRLGVDVAAELIEVVRDIENYNTVVALSQLLRK